MPTDIAQTPTTYAGIALAQARTDNLTSGDVTALDYRGVANLYNIVAL